MKTLQKTFFEDIFNFINIGCMNMIYYRILFFYRLIFTDILKKKMNHDSVIGITGDSDDDIDMMVSSIDFQDKVSQIL